MTRPEASVTTRRRDTSSCSTPASTCGPSIALPDRSLSFCPSAPQSVRPRLPQTRQSAPQRATYHLAGAALPVCGFYPACQHAREKSRSPAGACLRSDDSNAASTLIGSDRTMILQALPKRKKRNTPPPGSLEDAQPQTEPHDKPRRPAGRAPAWYILSHSPTPFA
ncbi:hypothetical protein PsYK624_165380 [Phanerochaete sordida]|uniref:Uncharacterized protein n=1 Tax=Phanerochaete sordida TaxID=48140 RepID=A0A9P3GSG1_9APHY|nr:hypothetical protein PsYK624_165380 [Phanerochaete sordida]